MSVVCDPLQHQSRLMTRVDVAQNVAPVEGVVDSSSSSSKPVVLERFSVAGHDLREEIYQRVDQRLQSYSEKALAKIKEQGCALDSELDNLLERVSGCRARQNTLESQQAERSHMVEAIVDRFSATAKSVRGNDAVAVHRAPKDIPRAQNPASIAKTDLEKPRAATGPPAAAAALNMLHPAVQQAMALNPFLAQMFVQAHSQSLTAAPPPVPFAGIAELAAESPIRKLISLSDCLVKEDSDKEGYGSCTFSIVLNKLDGQRLGMDVESIEEEGNLRISAMHSGGVVDSWNDQCDGDGCKLRQLKVGDFVVTANGFQGDCDAMLQTCLESAVVQLTVQRRNVLLDERPATLAWLEPRAPTLDWLDSRGTARDWTEGIAAESAASAATSNSDSSDSGEQCTPQQTPKSLSPSNSGLLASPSTTASTPTNSHRQAIGSKTISPSTNAILRRVQAVVGGTTTLS